MFISEDYPYIQVQVTIRGFSGTFRALIDTGFDGYFILPETISRQLGKPDFQVKAQLADGSERMSAEYLGKAEIVGLGEMYSAYFTLLGDECLVGQGIIKQLKMTFDHGKQVVLEL